MRIVNILLGSLLHWLNHVLAHWSQRMAEWEARLTRSVPVLPRTPGFDAGMDIDQPLDRPLDEPPEAWRKLVEDAIPDEPPAAWLEIVERYRVARSDAERNVFSYHAPDAPQRQSTSRAINPPRRVGRFALRNAAAMGRRRAAPARPPIRSIMSSIRSGLASLINGIRSTPATDETLSQTTAEERYGQQQHGDSGELIRDGVQPSRTDDASAAPVTSSAQNHLSDQPMDLTSPAKTPLSKAAVVDPAAQSRLVQQTKASQTKPVQAKLTQAPSHIEFRDSRTGKPPFDGSLHPHRESTSGQHSNPAAPYAPTFTERRFILRATPARLSSMSAPHVTDAPHDPRAAQTALQAAAQAASQTTSQTIPSNVLPSLPKQAPLTKQVSDLTRTSTPTASPADTLPPAESLPYTPTTASPSAPVTRQSAPIAPPSVPPTTPIPASPPNPKFTAFNANDPSNPYTAEPYSIDTSLFPSLPEDFTRADDTTPPQTHQRLERESRQALEREQRDRRR